MSATEAHNKLLAIANAANYLLDAMDRQHGSSPFSQNVMIARERLREALDRQPDQYDRAERVA